MQREVRVVRGRGRGLGKDPLGWRSQREGSWMHRLPASHGGGAWRTLCCMLSFNRGAGVNVTVLLGFCSC